LWTDNAYGGVTVRVLDDDSNDNDETVMAYHTQFQEFFPAWNNDNTLQNALLATEIYCDGNGYNHDHLANVAKAHLGALNAYLGKDNGSEEGSVRHCAPKHVEEIFDALDRSDLAGLPKAMPNSGHKKPAATFKPAAVTKPPPLAAEVTTISRRFVYEDDKSHKLWCISIPGPEDDETKVHFGKVGSIGSFQNKTHDSAENALKFVEKMVKDKTKKGYEEVPSELCCNVIAAAALPIQEIGAAAVGTKKRKATTACSPISHEMFTSRRFVYEDVKSHKFWCISVSGPADDETQVHYGRVGTVGVFHKKTHDSAKKALKFVAKMIKEKTKKGYHEVPTEPCCCGGAVAAKT
jgi:predicted DNA-binding WGR domain protein